MTAFWWAHLTMLWTNPINMYNGWYSTWPVATDTVVLSLPRIIGQYTAPLVLGSALYISVYTCQWCHTGLARKLTEHERTYTSTKCKVPWHEIAPAPLPWLIQTNVCCIINLPIKVPVFEHLCQYNMWIMVPHFPFIHLPTRTRVGSLPIVGSN